MYKLIVANDSFMDDVLIIGGGPTGIQVGIEAQKSGLSHRIIEKGSLVHSLFNFPINMTFFSTSEKLEIGNVPFVSHNPRPTRDEALEYYRRLYEHYDLNMQFYEEVTDVKGERGNFSIITDKNSYRASHVVIATGFYSVPNLMEIPGENLPHVSHYYNDPHEFINQKVVVIGAANSACDAALECWQKGADVQMLIRGDDINERVKYWIRPNIKNRIEEGSINAIFNVRVTEITPSSVVIERVGKRVRIPADYVLALTGYRPDYEFLRKLNIEVDNDEYATPICREETLQSTRKGIYLAGVIHCGLKTNRLFIENTRDHGEKIISHIIANN